jgi:hypothetical protein
MSAIGERSQSAYTRRAPHHSAPAQGAPDAHGRPRTGSGGEEAAAGVDQALHALAGQQAPPQVLRERHLWCCRQVG